MSDRPLRLCDVCGQLDDHPRHVQNLGPRGTVIRHMDCCASRGCETCAETEKANGGKRGQKLIDHLEKVRANG